MIKKVEDLKIFPTVAAVIGKAKAKVELFKLRDVDCGFFDDNLLGCAFSWSDTPQGYTFWSKIRRGENPYDNQ